MHETNRQQANIKVPDTYLILLAVALVAFLLTYFVPKGSFELTDTAQAGEGGRQTLVPESFTLQSEEPQGAPLFASGGDIGFLNIPFEGLVSGSKWGASIGVFAFILIAGGAFGIINATGSIHRAILRLILTSKRADIIAIPVLFFVFSLGGAIFGMGEEAIPFVLILVPILITMGYDSITGILITYVATQIGFSCSWMNPFSVSIAQGIAEVPLLSGAIERMALWALFTFLGGAFTLWYALKIKRDPKSSLAYGSDQKFASEDNPKGTNEVGFSYGDIIVLMSLLAAIAWVIWGVTQRQYYLPEIASQFFTLGIVAAIIGCVFKLNNMNANSAVESFRQGAMQLLPAAMVVAFASGIMLMLGSKSPGEPSVLNTILYSTSQAVGDLPAALAGGGMFLFQSVFNFFVTSGSGQAALTMPLMAPLADLVGVSRQVAVLAFQLGDGLTNIVVPTSASLMGCLGAARLDWSLWIRFVIKPFSILFALALGIVIVAVLTDFS